MENARSGKLHGLESGRTADYLRERLLSNIAQLVTKFVHDVSIKSGLSEKVANEAGGRIYTSGSYR
jgi:poly(A) polymerase Pap1